MSSDLIKFLPTILKEEARDGEPSFLEEFLGIFNDILLISPDVGSRRKRGVGEMLDVMGRLFHPDFAFLRCEDDDKTVSTEETKKRFNSYFDVDMEEFLDWLAGWTALVLKEDWPVKKKREIIAKIIPIYRMRGTKRGLEEYLKIYAGGDVTIIDKMEAFQVEEASYVEKDCVLEGLPPYFFIVNIKLPAPDPVKMRKKTKAVEDIVNAEKPVHTNYRLNISVPTFRVGEDNQSRVEMDTLLG